MYSTSDSSSIYPCCVCGEKHFDVLFSALDFDSGKKPFQLTRCRACCLVRTEPVSSDTELEQYYNLPYYGDSKKKFVGLAESITHFFSYRRARSILSQIDNTQKDPKSSIKKILDIGCGRGTLLKMLKNMGCECYGVERAEFPDDGPDRDIHFYSGKLEDISLPESFFDGVVIWHVLEHADNPMQMVREAARVLRPKGIISIAVPNFGSFQAGIFRESWFHLDLPRHRYHFTSDTLLQCLSRNGFSIVNRYTFSIEQNLFGFIQSFFNKIAPHTLPNRFYSLLKNMQGPSSAFSFLLWAALAVLVSPFAVLEYFLSGIFGRGATLIVYARRR